MSTRNMMLIATAAAAGVFLLGIPAGVARGAQQRAGRAARKALSGPSNDAYMAYFNRGWEVRMRRPASAAGTVRFEARMLGPEDLSNPADLTDPRPIGGATLDIAGQQLPFAWDGKVFFLDVPVSLLATQAGTVTVLDDTGTLHWTASLL
ncbi:MAG: hypothetical protein ACE5H3_03120 [Planctomycetota bacterium]